MKTKNKSSFGKRVRNFLKEGSISKGNRFYIKVEKVIEDRIEIINKDIKTSLELIQEQQEKYEDSIFNIDINRINSVTNRITYAKEYVEKMVNFKGKNIFGLTEDLNQYREELKVINAFQKDLDTLEPNIEIEEDE